MIFPEAVTRNKKVIGAQPSECQKYIERVPKNTQSSSDVHPCLSNSSFVSWDRILLSLLVLPQLLLDCCRLQQRLLPTCAFDPHCSLFHQGFVRRQPQISTSISSFLYLCSVPKKGYRTFCCIVSCIFICAASRSIEPRCTSIFLLLSSFLFCLHFWLPPPLWNLLRPSAPFT